MLSDNYVPTKDLGNGVTTIFTHDWNGINTDYVKVFEEDVTTGVKTEVTTGITKALNTDPSTGGSVTFDTAPTSSVYIIIARETPKSQDDPYSTSKGFPAKTVEANFDKNVAMLQESVEEGSRALVYPLGTDISGLGYETEIPLPTALYFLRWNAAGTGLENASGITSTDYAGDMSFGLDASKSATPAVGDIYIATDTAKYYVCYTTNNWTEVVIATTAQVLTNKRITKRAYSTTSTATLTPETDTYDSFALTAQAVALTIANPSTTTPNEGDLILIEITDDGTSQTIAWGTDYVDKGGLTLPVATVAGKTLTVLLRYSASLAKYNHIANAQEA